MEIFCILLLYATLCSAGLVNFASSTVPISDLFDNQAASSNGSGANFDNAGSTYDAQYLPTGTWNYDSVQYELPDAWAQGSDNIVAQGQTITIPNATYVHELHMVYAGDGSSTAFAVNFQLNFADNSTQTAQLIGKSWWSFPIINTGVIQTPYRFTNSNTSRDYNITQIYQWSTSVASESPLTAITLPQTGNSSERLHIFALSLTPSTPTSNTTSAPALAVRRATFSQLWESAKVTGKAQVVHVTLANLLPEAAFSPDTTVNAPLTAEINAPGLVTVSSGVVNRLAPGDQARFDVFVTGATNGTEATVTIKDAQGNAVGSSAGWPMSELRTNWSADAAVLSEHETPTWWNNAKFGIFIHWGVYSVPAWGPPSEYAEWYDWYQHIPSNPTYQYHLDTYGADVVYDDFIANFTASRFNASAWLDLFDNAGAKYFVQVTKHHEGFALFDTGNTTNRSSVALGPNRDLLDELFTTAKNEKPNIHRGTYYSLPEWYNPDYAQYGFSQWPGGLAHNAYNSSEVEPYTGHLNISDYLTDLQLPHMLTLAKKYGTEIMWCDIGGPNKTLDFAAAFYNHAESNGYQVTMNNRCGAVPDFDTPEYATYGAIQTRAWESSEGMDPFSYGLNRATNASQYKNGTTIITTLVDIVSKNGNYLLDIGPTAEGEIIAPMADNLLDAGSWLKYAGDCVYNTTYRFKGPQNTDTSDVSVRFLETPSTFCIVAMSKPTGGQLVVNERLPVLDGDTVTLLTPNGTSAPLAWSGGGNQGLTINVSDAEVDAVDYAWAFQVTYKLA